MRTCVCMYICALEMQQYINILPYRDTLSQWYSIYTNLVVSIYRISWYIDVLTLVLHIMCCSCMPALQFCNCLVGIKHYDFGKKALSICKNQLLYTIPYCAIYRCIVIQKRWYIDTHKMCIVASLVQAIYTLCIPMMRPLARSFAMEHFTTK